MWKVKLRFLVVESPVFERFIDIVYNLLVVLVISCFVCFSFPIPRVIPTQGKEDKGKGKFKLDLGLKMPKVNLGFIKGEEEEDEVDVVRIELSLISFHFGVFLYYGNRNIFSVHTLHMFLLVNLSVCTCW